MKPDFNKSTIEILGKRAAFICSNPDCRVNTIGPDSDNAKTIKIGEAAHIYGARIGAKRYDPLMTDLARSQITNAIWLCRNCHKLIDSDESRYNVSVLFKWREMHEEHVTMKLGNNTDKLVYDELRTILKQYDGYSPTIRRLIIDKPSNWEYRFTIELMDELNQPIIKKMNDLRNGLYIKSLEFVDRTDAFNWIKNRVSEMQNLIGPFRGLLEALSRSFGEPGVAGNSNEIHHVTKLIQNYLEQALLFEEKLYFTVLPNNFKKLQNLLKDRIGSQIEKFDEVPRFLEDKLESFSENDNTGSKVKNIQRTIKLDVPENWEMEFNNELNKMINSIK